MFCLIVFACLFRSFYTKNDQEGHTQLDCVSAALSFSVRFCLIGGCGCRCRYFGNQGMNGDGRQRAKENKSKNGANQANAIRRLPGGSAWYTWQKPKQNRKSNILLDCVLGGFVVKPLVLYVFWTGRGPQGASNPEAWRPWREI